MLRAVAVAVGVYAVFMATAYLAIFIEVKTHLEKGPFEYLYSDAGFFPDDEPHGVHCSTSLFSIRPDKLLTQNLLTQAGILSWSGEVPIHFGALVVGDGLYYWSFKERRLLRASEDSAMVSYRDFAQRGYRCRD